PAAPVNVRALRIAERERGGQNDDGGAVPAGKECRPRSLGREVIPAARGRDDIDAEREERQPGPEVRGAAKHLLLLFLGRLARRRALFLRHLLRLGLLIATLRHDLANDAAGRTTLDRHDAGIADDLAAERADALLRAGKVRDFDGEVMDAWAFAGRARFGRLRTRVVLDQREIDRAIAQVPRRVVAHAVGAHLAEAEYLAVELGGALEVIDLKRQMHDAAHHVSFSRGLSLRILPNFSRLQTASQRRRARALPKTGAIRSAAFASTSSRVIGFSAVPRTALMWWRSSRPPRRVNSTIPWRLGIAALSASSPRSSIRARSASTLRSRIRRSSCAA